jgi:hypothetical protein
MHAHEFDGVVTSRLAFVHAQLAGSWPANGRQGRFNLRQAHSGNSFLFHRQRANRAGWANLPAVVARGFATGPVGVDLGCPQSCQAMLEAGGLKDVVGAGLKTFATPDAGLQEFFFRQTSRRAHGMHIGRCGKGLRGGDANASETCK